MGSGIEATAVLVVTVLCLRWLNSIIWPDRRQAILKMCAIPRDWRAGTGVTRKALAARSGIRFYLRDLRLEEVVACLDAHPELIAEWETDIADRRGPGGWSYGETVGGYELGEVGAGMRFTCMARFRDRSEVCAVFVLLWTAVWLGADFPAAQQALQGPPLRGAP
jgi:hypothetical protein